MLDFLSIAFVQRALLAGTVIGLIVPFVGMFVVVRRLSPLADTLSHVSLVGILSAIFMGIQPIFGGLVVSVLAAIGMEKLRQDAKIYAESALMLFLSFSVALIAVLSGMVPIPGAGLESYLFGSLTTVTAKDIPYILLGSAAVLVIILWSYKSLFLVVMDEELAKVGGIPVRAYNYLLMSLAAVVVTAGVTLVGGLLIGSMMVIPVISALQFRMGFRATQAVACLLSLTSVWMGFFLSYHLNLALGGSIVLLNVSFFFLSFWWQKLRLV